MALLALTMEFSMEGFWNRPSLWLCGAAGAVAVPVAVSVAVLRYHLYAIDRIINRALVYTALSAVLGLGYVVGVMLLRWVFSPVIGRSGLAVAGSTLAMAALFRPLRRRIQDAVDRRFNRHRFDAARIIEAYSSRLRQETNLDVIAADLLAVLDETMEPVHASLWLRPPDRPPAHRGPGW